MTTTPRLEAAREAVAALKAERLALRVEADRIEQRLRAIESPWRDDGELPRARRELAAAEREAADMDDGTTPAAEE